MLALAAVFELGEELAVDDSLHHRGCKRRRDFDDRAFHDRRVRDRCASW